jgi:heme exporter protein A
MMISGDNGSGKSTLLRHIAGIAPHTGTCTWFDKPIHASADYERDMMYIGDKHGLYEDLTVSQQLHFFASHYGNTLLIDATIRYMECEPYLHTRISSLSAGWKRRVALCRLLLIPTLLWLLDEPMMHLDAHSIRLLGGLIQSHAEKGGACIMTMPYMDVAPAIYNTPVSLLRMQDFMIGEEA